MKAKKKLCRIKGCKGEARARHMCEACYSSAYHAVRRKSTTWEELSKTLGIPLTKRRKPTPFMAVLRKKHHATAGR